MQRKGAIVLKIVKEHSKILLALILTLSACVVAFSAVLSCPATSYASGGSISIKSSSSAYTIVFQAFRIADAYGNPLLPAATEDELSARPEFEGLHGVPLMSAVLQKVSEDENFANEFAAILEAADSSLPRAVVKSDIDPVLVEDGWYALSGTRMYNDGRTQKAALIVLEVRGEPVSMEEKPLDELPPPEPPAPDENKNGNDNIGDENQNENINQNRNENDDIDSNNTKTQEASITNVIGQLGDNIPLVILAVICGVACGLIVVVTVKRNRRE